MDRGKILDVLELPPGGSLNITDVQIVQWGRNMVFICQYNAFPDPLDSPYEPVEFHLTFRDCREMKYRIYAHISEHELGQISPVATVVEIALGHGNHRRDANILTNHFSITISYGQVEVENAQHRFVFAV